MELTLPRLSQPLKLWEKIELVTGDGNQAGFYTARIEDFVNEGIVISSPEYVKGKTLLRENSDLVIMITKADAVYKCSTRIKKYHQKGSNLFVLSQPRHVRRVQRRQFVRIDIWEPIEYARIITLKGEENYEEHLNWCRTTTINMSGGGILLKLTENIDVQDKLLLKVGCFPEVGLPAIVAGICRRIVIINDKDVGGVEFLTSDVLTEHFRNDELKRLPKSIKGFDHQVQNQLVNFIFQRQIEMRQKGLL
ncbi:MAG: flagellar brake protein [candidate division Zixibacteria bacterium]|nr:flagellar brake protein [candidate division Zixibacteria bacterium]